MRAPDRCSATGGPTWPPTSWARCAWTRPGIRTIGGWLSWSASCPFAASISAAGGPGQTVVEWGQGSKTLHHTVVGRLTLDTEAVTFPGDPDQTLIVFMSKPGSPSQHALDLLAMA